MLDSLQDLRYAVRMLFKHPVQNGAIVLILAFGIAANTAMYAGFDAWVVRPLPLERPETLVTLNETQPKLGSAGLAISPANLRDWREQSRSLDRIEAYDRELYNFLDEEDPERLQGARISAGLFPMLGVEPVRGRNFLASEDLPDGPRVALISHRLWQRRFGGDPDVVGTTVRLDDLEHEIVGVMAPGFQFPEWGDVWTPLGLEPAGGARDRRFLNALGRLAPGFTVAEAHAEIAGIAGRLAALYPAANAGWSAEVLPARREWVPPVIRVALTASMGAAAFVLLIICANVANLMLAQANGRQREIALRSALGAGRRRLVRQTLTESILLALIAGGLGAVLGQLGVRWMISWVPVEVPYMFRFAVDERSMLFTLAVSLVTGLACGLAPVLRASGIDLVETLKSGGRAGDGPTAVRWRGAFVACELAFSMLLLIGALLMVRSFFNQQRLDTGYRTRDVLTLRASLTGRTFDEWSDRVRYLDRALSRLRDLPEVTHVAAVNHLPSSQSGYHAIRLEIEGRAAAPGEEPRTSLVAILGDYFGTLDIPIVAGRPFTPGEMLEEGDVAIVGESLAELLWPGQEALGRRLRDTASDDWLTVVGVAGHVDPGHRMVDFGDRPDSQLYVPYRHAPYASPTLNVTGPSATSRKGLEILVPAVRSALRAVDASVPISDVVAIDRAIERVQWVSRYFSRLFSLYAVLALAIASVGAYGVTADTVSRRMVEMGIRSALGARPRDLLRMVLVGHGLRFGLLGVMLGLLLAWPLTGFLSSMLYGVEASDPLTFAGVTALMTAIALLASLLPARQAARVDPIEVLRCD